jgi:hypothetical protein
MSVNYCDVPGCYNEDSKTSHIRRHNATVIQQRQEACHADDDDVITLIESEREAWALGAGKPKHHDVFLAFQKHAAIWDRNMDEFFKPHHQRDMNCIMMSTSVLFMMECVGCQGHRTGKMN